MKFFKDNIKLILLITLSILFIILFYLLFDAIQSSKDRQITIIKSALIKTAEGAYAEGQRDAINRDIRLDLMRNCWIKSPWDNKEPSGVIKMCK